MTEGQGSHGREIPEEDHRGGSEAAGAGRGSDGTGLLGAVTSGCTNSAGATAAPPDTLAAAQTVIPAPEPAGSATLPVGIFRV